MSLLRLRTDFRFAILTLFGAVSMLGIIPFALLRFASGQTLAGLIDSAIVACIVGALAYIWRGGNVDRACMVSMVAYTIGCVAIAILVGFAGVLWMYPVLLANYLLVSRSWAVAASVAAIGAVSLHGGAFESGLHLGAFVVTSSVVSLFAFIFAHRAAIQRDQLESLASRDPLTGAHNRRAMERDLQLAIAADARHRTVVALALFDLDHFKRINDSHGHEAGDAVLIAFTQLMSRHTRNLDQLYRVGGEEFVLLLPGADRAALSKICETLRAQVEAELRCRDETITVSIGAAALQSDDTTATWLARTDAAMYRAKNQGRNRVEIAGDQAIAEEPQTGASPGAGSPRPN